MSDQLPDTGEFDLITAYVLAKLSKSCGWVLEGYAYLESVNERISHVAGGHLHERMI